MIAAVVAAAIGMCHADSPLTSTDFSKAYMDIPIVQQAASEGVMSLELAEYLSSPDVSIDIKAALIDALGWSVNGKHNAELYRYYLALRYRRPLDEPTPDLLMADEMFCLGYLTAMDDYFHVEKAIPLLARARARNPKSFTVAIILAMAKGQAVRSKSFEKSWQMVEQVLNNEGLNQDLREKAKEAIVAYMKLYKTPKHQNQ